MNILIVDDSESIINMVGIMLEEWGDTYTSVLDGVEAYKLLKKRNDIDLVLLEWNIPNMDGLQLLKKNKEERFTETPVIMMSSNTRPEQIQKALVHGAAEYIMKPFTSDILFNKMELVNECFN